MKIFCGESCYSIYFLHWKEVLQAKLWAVIFIEIIRTL